jgi:hypothetical protein
MKTRNVVSLALVTVLLISLLCVWFVPSVQDFMAGNTMWNGIRNALNRFDGNVVESLDVLPGKPESTALITIPYVEYTEEDLSRLKDFVVQGGTLVVMDDYGFGNQIMEYLGIAVRFDSNPLLDPLFCYQNQWFPKITDFSPEIGQKDIKTVVLNHAGTIQNTAGMQVLAWSSTNSFLDSNRNERQDAIESIGPFPIAVKTTVGEGTLVLASDPSLMINSMVDRNDNFAFINALISIGGDKNEFLLDTSHLSKTPLDVSKSTLGRTLGVLSTPYSLLTIMAVVFIIVSRSVLTAGGTIEGKS